MSAPTRGLLREAPLLLAGALLVFVALAGFTLLAYRDAVARFGAERQEEAAALADRLAREAARRGAVRVEELAPMLPAGAALALYRGDGTTVASVGYGEPPPLAIAGTAPGSLIGAVALGPERTGLPAVVGIAPYPHGAERRYLRVDLPAPTLAGRIRSLAWLTPVVLGLALGAAALLVLYVRALARPYEALLERAREVGAPVEAGRDELAALLATFDRALAALAERPPALDQLRDALGGELDGGFLLLDREAKLLAATPAASELLAIDPPAPGIPIAEALAGRPELVATLEQAVASGAPLPRAAIAIERGEGATTLGVTAEPLRGEGGRARGWLVVVADHTELERRAAEERLADGLAQLGELSAGVAHELRNSLAALSGWVALASREELPEPARECLTEIARESTRLTRVVEDFLAFARPGTRRLEPVELAEVLTRAIHDPALDGHPVELAAERGATLRGDPELLERVFRNLLANAVRAEREAGVDGPVEVRLEPRGGAWEIRIEDRGSGLPDSIRERLFEPFASASAEGAGLGLALARRILVLHRGSIELEDREGGGTRARIRLPRDASVTEGNEEGVGSDPPPGSDLQV